MAYAPQATLLGCRSAQKAPVSQADWQQQVVVRALDSAKIAQPRSETHKKVISQPIGQFRECICRQWCNQHTVGPLSKLQKGG